MTFFISSFINITGSYPLLRIFFHHITVFKFDVYLALHGSPCMHACTIIHALACANLVNRTSFIKQVIIDNLTSFYIV